MAGYRRQEKGNVLWKHAVDKHEGSQEANYKMNVLNTFGRDNTMRKTDEALRISGHKGVILNSKSEFRQPSLPRFEIQLGRNTQ